MSFSTIAFRTEAFFLQGFISQIGDLGGQEAEGRLVMWSALITWMWLLNRSLLCLLSWPRSERCFRGGLGEGI